MRMLKPSETAARLAISPRTLAGWRARKAGPPVVKVSARAVRYPIDGLERWISRRELEVGK